MEKLTERDKKDRKEICQIICTLYVLQHIPARVGHTGINVSGDLAIIHISQLTKCTISYMLGEIQP